MKISIRSFLFLFIFFSFFAFSFFGSITRSYAAPTPTPAQSTDDQWTPDADVTFAGKSVQRASNFLQWNLQNYQWASVNDQALSSYWVTVRNVVYALLLLVIFSAAIVMIVTRGGNMTVWGFVRNFLIIIILITFSYALIRIIYQLTDIVQGFFGANNIASYIASHQYLLPIKFTDIDNGRRLSGIKYDESAFVTINLLKITAITYYVMGCVLLVRKIILWFFLIISPIFPLLILYMPLKNTAKIWIGEFFRWLLYAPLFTLFLSGLLVMWNSGTTQGINILPLNLTSTAQTYPTAIDIFIAGPGATPGLTNSLNYNDTFIQYVAAILMLWAVTLLPFLLLRIFLDYVSNLSIEEEGISYIKKGLNRLSLGGTPFGNSSGSTKVEKTTSGNMSSRTSSVPFQHRDVPGTQEVESPIANQPPIMNVASTFTTPTIEPTTPSRETNIQSNFEPLRKINLPNISENITAKKEDKETESPLPPFSAGIPLRTTITEPKKTSEPEQHGTQPFSVNVPKYDISTNIHEDNATRPTEPHTAQTHNNGLPSHEANIEELKQI